LGSACPHRLRTIGAARGATAPLWSSDRESLVFLADDGVWLLPELDAKPVRIATPLFTPSSWPSYFGGPSSPRLPSRCRRRPTTSKRWSRKHVLASGAGGY